MEYVKNLVLVPLLSMFSSWTALLPFDLMGMLGLKTATPALGNNTFNLDTL